MKTHKPKVSIVGTGNVGSTFAYALMMRGAAREIALIDRKEERRNGEAMDLNHGASFVPPVFITSGGYETAGGSDIVVITAGARQKPGQTRMDLVKTNTEIFKNIVPEIQKYAPDAIFLIVSNPMDILTYVTLKISGLPHRKVIGSGTVLDSSRLRYLISDHCHVDPRNVHAYIIGEHGDSELAVWSHANIAGMVLAEYCPICNSNCNYKEELSNIFESVKNSAYEIIKAKGSTYYAIGLALVKTVEAILRDENSVLPVSTLVNDYYGINDVCLSIPSVVSKGGVKDFLRLRLSEEEEKKLKTSADALKGVLRKIGF